MHDLSQTSINAVHVPGAVSPPFLLRIGGLPIDIMDHLRLVESASWRDTVLALEKTLLARKEQLVEALHTAVSIHKEDQKLRRKLINLKRNIFNLRSPGENGEAHLLIDLLPSSEGHLLAEWLSLWETYQQTLTAGSRLLENELGWQRILLKQVIDTPDFRKGLLLASPLLDQALDAYKASDNLHLNREARTVERSVFEYLQRTTCKTSPFSTFTPVCFGRFLPGETPRGEYVTSRFKSLEKRSFVKLNMAVLSRLSSALLTVDEIMRDLPLCVTPGWQREQGQIKYVRRKHSARDSNDEQPIDFAIVHESLFSLPASRLVNDLLDLIGKGQVAKLGEIVELLCTATRYQNVKAEVETYLRRLLQLGFLIVPPLQIDIHAPNPLTAYIAGLYSMNISLTTHLAGELEAVDAIITAYAAASVADRYELMASARQKLAKCFALISPSSAEQSLAEEGLVHMAAPPRTLFYEDTTVRPEQLTISEGNWRPLLSHAAELLHLLPIFDLNQPYALLTKGYFHSRYGPGCVNFLTFADTFNTDFWDQYRRTALTESFSDKQGGLLRHANPFNQSEIELLNDARQAVADFVTTSYTNLPPGSTELILDDTFVKTLAPYVPNERGRLRSHALFAQLEASSSEALLVVNWIYSGLTMMFSRFAYCFQENEGYAVIPTLRSQLLALQPPGAVFAEMKGGYDATNLNLHPPVTAYELACPGELSTRLPDEQIPLEDLFVQDDPQRDRLRLFSRRLEKEVIPLYLGFMMPMLLPEIQQVLLNFSPCSMCPLKLWDGVSLPETSNTITFTPRLRYKNIVLQRASWHVPVLMFPQRQSGQSDPDFLLAISRWRRAHQLPSRVFFTSSSVPASANVADKPRDYKPLFIDFENFFSLQLLEATVRSLTQPLIFTEMLPQRNHLWLKHNNQSYVSEFVFEMNRQEKLL